MELISKEEVIEAIQAIKEVMLTNAEVIKIIDMQDVIKIDEGYIEELERKVNESRPKGVWLGISYDGYADGNPVYTEWKCSNCGLEINDDNGENLWNYCPDRGADMREGTGQCDTNPITKLSSGTTGI